MGTVVVVKYITIGNGKEMSPSDHNINFNENPKLSEIENVIEWLDQMNLSRPKKRIHRDFADGVLLAEILKHYYPKYVEMHNYTSRYSFATKMDNWKTLNIRVLKKINMRMSTKTMEDICNCIPGVIEKVLIDLRTKIRKEEEKKLQDVEEDKVSSDGSWYDVRAIDEESIVGEIMFVPMRKKCSGDTVEVFWKKVISYDCFETVKNEVSEKNEAIDILRQKVQHLENLLKTKDFHIDELQKNLSRKNLRSKKNEVSLIDSKPEILGSILGLEENTKVVEDNLPEPTKSSTELGEVTDETLNDLITFIDA